MKDYLSNNKFACFGDSITSDQVTGIGTAVNSLLSTSLIGNFACGWATCSDWHDSERDITPVSLITPQNTDTSDNVLSNQVRRMLQHTTASGSQITWTHPTDGTFSIDIQGSVGMGLTEDIPDIIYIAVGTNDGKNFYVPVNDDTAEVFSQTYAELSRNSIASALRWAIETFQSAYPNVQIFVASPLQAFTNDVWMNYDNGKLKCDIIERVCEFCSVNFINSFSDSGFSSLVASANGCVHPNDVWKHRIANYVAREIRKKFRRYDKFES